MQVGDWVKIRPGYEFLCEDTGVFPGPGKIVWKGIGNRFRVQYSMHNTPVLLFINELELCEPEVEPTEENLKELL